MRATLATSACAVVLAAGLPMPADAGARSRCPLKGAHRIAATRSAIAFRDHGRTFACLYRTGRRFWLKDSPQEPDFLGARSVRLAGPYVGYELAFIGRSDPHFEVRVRDLRNGRWLWRLPAMTPGTPGTFTADDPGVSDLEVTSSGAVAWIARNPLVDPFAIELHKADADGPALLSSGADIDPGSLALSGSVLYWLQRTEPQTATLR